VKTLEGHQGIATEHRALGAAVAAEARSIAVSVTARPIASGDRAAGATVVVFLALGLFGAFALSARHEGAPFVAVAVLGVGVLWALFIRISMAELERSLAESRAQAGARRPLAQRRRAARRRSFSRR
jgi:hypothetical protein